MDNRKRGEELNQLSRLLFDKGANQWYLAIFIEIIAVILGVLTGLFNPPDDWKLPVAIVGFCLFAVAYGLRLFFANTYDNAETMRRQSVLTEALDWPIGQTQFSEWRRKAGNDILKRFRLQPRSADYYATQQTNPPKRLLEMTAESAFWTRHLYAKLQGLIWLLFIGAIITIIIVISIAPAQFIPSTIHSQIVYAVYLLLPILLSADLLGWALRLGRLISSIKEVEQGLEALSTRRSPKESEVMRLVSEYNCQLTAGFPIHDKLFSFWHDEIDGLWKNR